MCRHFGHTLLLSYHLEIEEGSFLGRCPSNDITLLPRIRAIVTVRELKTADSVWVVGGIFIAGDRWRCFGRLGVGLCERRVFNLPIYLIADTHADTCVSFTPSWNASPSSSKSTTAGHGW